MWEYLMCHSVLCCLHLDPYMAVKQWDSSLGKVITVAFTEDARVDVGSGLCNIEVIFKESPCLVHQ